MASGGGERTKGQGALAKVPSNNDISRRLSILTAGCAQCWFMGSDLCLNHRTTDAPELPRARTRPVITRRELYDSAPVLRDYREVSDTDLTPANDLFITEEPLRKFRNYQETTYRVVRAHFPIYTAQYQNQLDSELAFCTDMLSTAVGLGGEILDSKSTCEPLERFIANVRGHWVRWILELSDTVSTWQNLNPGAREPLFTRSFVEYALNLNVMAIAVCSDIIYASIEPL